MTIRRRLGFAFAAVLGLFALNLTLYLWSASQRTAALERVGASVERQMLTARLHHALSDLRRMIEVTTESAEGHSTLPAATLENYAARTSGIYDTVEGIVARASPVTPYSELRPAVNDLLASQGNLLRAHGVDPATAVTERVRSATLAQSTEQILRDIEQRERALAGAARADSYAVARLTNALTLFLFAGSGVLAIALYLGLSRHLSRSLVVLRVGADRFGSGNLEHRIVPPEQDELGALAQGFNAMAQNLSRARSELTQANFENVKRAIEVDTHRKALEEKKRELEFFLRLEDQTDDAQVIIDLANGRLLKANAAACAALGVRKEDWLGQDLREHPRLGALRDNWEKLRQVLSDQAATRLEWQLDVGDGAKRPFEINARRIAVGRGQYLVAVARDVTHTKQLQEQLRALSRIDPLTGIPNRRAFDERLALEWQRSVRGHRPLSLLAVDVDWFKAYNDSLGHPAGDACLKAVAQAMNHCLRNDVDFLARHGGEEFAALLPEASTLDAQVIAERLRLAVLDLRLPHPAAPSGEFVTVSVGHSTMSPKRGDRTEALVSQADAALYQAKRAGRDRVVEYAAEAA